MQDTTLRRLVLIKRLYLEGIDKAQSHFNYADQILSVLNLFLAVETLMGAVVQERFDQPDEVIGIKGYWDGKPPSIEQVSKFSLGNNNKFSQLYDQVVAILRFDQRLDENGILFRRNLLERLQKARNDAQHGAKAPHPSDLPELAAIAKEFIERVLFLSFSQLGSSLSEVSLSNLIKDEVLRRSIKLAEAAIQNEQYDVSALLARVAFLLGRKKRRYDWWKYRKGQRIIDDFDTSNELSRDWGTRLLDDKETRLLYNIMREVSVLPYLLDNWLLGLDNMDRSRLLEWTPRLMKYPDKMVGLPPSDEVIITTLMDSLVSGDQHWEGANFQNLPDKNQSLWVVDYVTDTLLRWQQEERGRFTAINIQYLDALTKLEKI